MADATSAAPGPRLRKRRLWLRVLGWAFSLVVVPLIVLYYIATSPAFFKNHILPRISRSLNANVIVGSVTISPFSQIVLRDLKVQSTNEAPLITAREVRVKYKLFDILGGNIRVDEADLISPVFQLVQNADGTSNVDPISRASEKNAKEKTRKRSKPTQLDIRKVFLSDATFRRIQNQKAGTRDLVELTNIDLTITGVRNGGSGKLEFTSILRGENNPPAPAMYGLLQAKVEGHFDFTLAPDLKPGMVLGDAHLNIGQAAGSFSDFAKLDGTLHCDVSSTEFKSVTLNFERDGLRLGELRATGPYDAEKAEGQLNVELLSVDKQVLNLFGARYGIDFGSTTMTSTNEIQVAKAGAAISAAGRLVASKFQLSRTNESTPPLDVRADYNVSIDKTEKTALLRALNVTGTQNGRPLLRGELTSPMTLAWGAASNSVGDSSLNIVITRLNIADWKSFAGNLASAGTLDSNMKLLSQQGGTELTFDATNRIEGLSTQIADQHISDVTLLLGVRGRATDLKLFNLTEYNLQLVQSNQLALAISGAGTYDRTNSSADLQVKLEATLARTLRLLNRFDVTASSGNAELTARVTQEQQIQTLTGNFSLTKYTGTFASRYFTNFGAAMELNLEKTPDQINLYKVAGKVAGEQGSSGDFNLSGTYGMVKKPSQFTMNFSDFNEDCIRPLVEPFLAGRRLVSVSLDGTVSMQMNPNGNSSVRGDVQVGNLTLSGSAQQAISGPLDAKVQLDTATSKKITDIHQIEIALTPTRRAKNDLQLQGHIDASKPNSIQGNLKLTADSLDLTSYYDLFNITNKPVARLNVNGRNKPQNTAASAQSPQAQQEWAVIQLPLTNFTVDASAREFYLREMGASNFQATAKLDGSHAVLKPIQFTLDGSPVLATADVDMSVPGWKWTVTCNATNAPFAPLWNTFIPEYKGEVGGMLTVFGSLSGVGRHGESLQKTLTSTFQISGTNLNLYPGTIHNGMLRGVVELVAGMSEIIVDPISAIKSGANLLSGKLSGSLAGDVGKSPINVITLQGVAGNGRIDLQNALVQSDVFKATTTNGSITLAPALTNSTINIPIGIALNRSVGPRLPYLNSVTTETNNNYVKLPDFFSERGTIGSVKKNIDVLALTAGMVKQEVSGVATNVLVSPLQNIGGLLRNQVGTNESASNQTPANPLSNSFTHLMSK